MLDAGRVGSAFAAELGTMQVSEQTDSLRVLGTDPVDYLVSPRLLACMIAGPVLNLMCFAMGMPYTECRVTSSDLYASGQAVPVACMPGSTQHFLCMLSAQTAASLPLAAAVDLQINVLHELLQQTITLHAA